MQYTFWHARGEETREQCTKGAWSLIWDIEDTTNLKYCQWILNFASFSVKFKIQKLTRIHFFSLGFHSLYLEWNFSFQTSAFVCWNCSISVYTAVAIFRVNKVKGCGFAVSKGEVVKLSTVQREGPMAWYIGLAVGDIYWTLAHSHWIASCFTHHFVPTMKPIY
jgi:hypothetical protein